VKWKLGFRVTSLYSRLYFRVYERSSNKLILCTMSYTDCVRGNAPGARSPGAANEGADNPSHSRTSSTQARGGQVDFTTIVS
jgi:hypothetical protein